MKIIKIIKSNYISREMWKEKMEDPILPRRPFAEEMKNIKQQGLVKKEGGFSLCRHQV